MMPIGPSCFANGNYKGAHFDFFNNPNIAQELVYLTTFCYKKQLIRFLEAWSEWLDKNADRMQFTDDEKEEWDSICNVVNECPPSNLGLITMRIGVFWTRYQEAQT